MEWSRVFPPAQPPGLGDWGMDVVQDGQYAYVGGTTLSPAGSTHLFVAK